MYKLLKADHSLIENEEILRNKLKIQTYRSHNFHVEYVNASVLLPYRQNDCADAPSLPNLAKEKQTIKTAQYNFWISNSWTDRK